MFGEYVKSKEDSDAMYQSTYPDPGPNIVAAPTSTAKKRHVFGRSATGRVAPIRLDPEVSELYYDLARKERRSHGDVSSRNDSSDWAPSNNTIPETLNSSKEWKVPYGMDKKHAASQNDVRATPNFQGMESTPLKYHQGGISRATNTFEKENFFTPRKNSEAPTMSTPAQSRCPLSALPVESQDTTDGFHAQPADMRSGSSSVKKYGVTCNLSNYKHDQDTFRTPQSKPLVHPSTEVPKGRQRLYATYKLPEVALHPAVIAGQQQAKQLQMQRDAQMSSAPVEGSISRKLIDSTPLKSNQSASNSVVQQAQARPTFGFRDSHSSNENFASSKSWLSHTKPSETSSANAVPPSVASTKTAAQSMSHAHTMGSAETLATIQEKQLSPPMSATESTWLPASRFPHLYSSHPKPGVMSENCASRDPACHTPTEAPNSNGPTSHVVEKSSDLLKDSKCTPSQVSSVPPSVASTNTAAQSMSLAHTMGSAETLATIQEKQLSPPMSATESTWLPASRFPHLYSSHPKPGVMSENCASRDPARHTPTDAPNSNGPTSHVVEKSSDLLKDSKCTPSQVSSGTSGPSMVPALAPTSKICDPARICTQTANAVEVAAPQSVKSEPIKSESQKKMNPERKVTSSGNGQIKVNGRAYDILSILGRGGSSKVYQVLDPETSQLKAVKCVNLAETDPSICDGYLNEIKLLADLQDGDCVIRMYDHEHHKESSTLFVVMEKGDTDLSRLIKDLKNSKKISATMIAYYWTEMLNAVSFIHKRGTIHSDLKPANFLLVSGRLKLIDFGIASSVQEDMTSVIKDNLTGTYNYISPEALSATSSDGQHFKISYKSDVWSLGCILYNLVYGRTPFQHITGQFQKLNAIVSPSHKIKFPDPPISDCPSSLIEAMKMCLIRNPKDRASVDELLQIPYMGQAGPERAFISKIVKLTASVGLVQDTENSPYAVALRSIQRLIIENESKLPFLRGDK